MNDFHGHHDVHLVTKGAGFDSVLDSEVAALDVEGRFEASSLSLAHVLGGDESHQSDNRLGHAIHGEVAHDIPDILRDAFDLGALEEHVLVFLRVEEIGTHEMLVKIVVAAVHAAGGHLNVELEGLLRIGWVEGDLPVDVVEATPEVSSTHVLYSEHGGGVDAVQLVITFGHVRKWLVVRGCRVSDGAATRHGHGKNSGKASDGQDGCKGYGTDTHDLNLQSGRQVLPAADSYSCRCGEELHHPWFDSSNSSV